MDKLDFLKATNPDEFVMRERLLEAAKKGNPDGLPWWQAGTDRLLKAAPEGSDEPYEFVISTPVKDRYGDTVRAEGIDNTAFRKNPVVPWGHETRSLPIGTSLGEKVVKGADYGLEHKKVYKADMVFDIENDPNGFAAAVKGKVDRRHLSATSISFNPNVYEPIYEEVELSNGGTEERWTGGFDFIEVDLLEWSIVSVPANPETVRRAFGLLTRGEPADDLDEKIRVAIQKVVPDLAQFRKDVELLRDFMDRFEDDPFKAVRQQVDEELSIERACDTFRDLQSRIGG